MAKQYRKKRSYRKKRKGKKVQKGRGFGGGMALGMLLPQILGTVSNVLKINI